MIVKVSAPAPLFGERAAATRVAVVAALSATTMLFASLSSAYLVRRSLPDWSAPQAASWPWGLLGIAVLVSVFLECYLRADTERVRRASLASTAFVSAAYLAAASAVIASVSASGLLRQPHSAFVVLLLGLHALHSIVGGGFTFRLMTRREVDGSDLVFLARSVTHFLTALVGFIVFLLFVIR